MVLTQKRLKQLLNYNSETGIFTWKETRTFTALSGSTAGSKNSCGYIRIKLDGQEQMAHRLAWMFIHGKLNTQLEIDHINGVRDDNRILNLRQVNSSQQRMNSKLNRDNTSGYRGVVKDSRGNGRWRVFIQREFVGSFKTKEDAIIAHTSEFNRRFGVEYRRPS
jgi:hypothetical protein